jgi:hypothetical protein
VRCWPLVTSPAGTHYGGVYVPRDYLRGNAKGERLKTPCICRIDELGRYQRRGVCPWSRLECPQTPMHDDYADKMIAGWGDGQNNQRSVLLENAAALRAIAENR